MWALMTAIFSLVNQSFSWLNINLTIKNKIYTIIGWGVWINLCFMFINYLNIHFYKMAVLFGILILFLFYFLILNSFYYFKNKNFKWDFSQKFAPIIEQEKVNYLEDIKDLTVLYDSKTYTALAEMNFEPLYLEEINKILSIVKSERKVDDITKSKVFSGYEYDNFIIPNANIVKENGAFYAMIGINGFHRHQKRLGQITSIANYSIEEMFKYYDLKIKSISVSGGKYYKRGTFIKEDDIDIKVYIEFH